jgi:YkoY family integral membrane protein
MLNVLLSDVPLILWYVGVLVFLEGLLSADNALVLAVMVRHLSKADQRRVLQFGIWGAIGFRVVAVALAGILLKFWFFKFLGGLYLLYLAIAHFLQRDHSGDTAAGGTTRKKWSQTFWGTVTSVTFTDIAFSIDSILTAVAMAEGFPQRFGENGKLGIVIVGGVLGIITMRFVVKYFVVLLERFPGLAEGAYVLIAWIGLKLLLSGLHDYDEKQFPYHMPEWMFWVGMAIIGVASFWIKARATSNQTPELAEGVDLLGDGPSSP